MLWANLHLLFWLSLFPFATGWMGENHFAPRAHRALRRGAADGGRRLLGAAAADPARGRVAVRRWPQQWAATSKGRSPPALPGGHRSRVRAPLAGACRLRFGCTHVVDSGSPHRAGCHQRAAHPPGCVGRRLTKRLQRREPSLKIWIDADAAPRDVKELVFRAAKRLAIETVLVANQRLQTPPGNPLVSAVWVDGGADVADQYIAAHASAGDLVVTQDVPLAALLVPRRVAVLDPRGDEHTPETIGERLSVRDFMDQARMAGAVTGGPPPYDARARQAFAAALDRVLTRLRRPS